jgi:DNA-binding winged helix-turn-helix (wHTH) protein/Tfp pilus assembly protein PilF
MEPSRDAHQGLNYYEFGPFRFDPRDRVLARRGVNVPLSPKAAELLLLFVQSHGRLLPKETLIASLWPDTFVEESSLSQTVFLLRKALGEPYIETIPRRGFRFTAPVREVDSSRRPNGVATRFAAALIAVAVTATLVFAVRREPVVFAGERLPANIAPSAREAYLKGRHHWNRRTVSDFEKAVDYFRDATEQEPRFALAWAGLADAYNFLGQAPRAAVAARRALEIDDSCAPAWAALANVNLFHDFDWDGAERAFQRAIELDPNYATTHQWRAYSFLTRRRFAQAKIEMAKARDLDPLSTIITTDVGTVHFYAGEYEEALVHFRRALELDPGFLQAQHSIAWSYYFMRDYRRAEEEFARHDQGVLAEVAMLCARGETKRALDVLSAIEHSQDPQTSSNYAIACAFALAGDNTRALHWLDRAYAARTGQMTMIHVDPLLAGLRRDPAFAEFVKARGLR